MTPANARSDALCSNLTTPPPTRSSIKGSGSDSINASRSKRKDALREFGRRQRHAILAANRHSLSPVDLTGKLHADTMAAIRAQLHQPEEGAELTEADIEQLLRDIESQVLAEIQAEIAELERYEQEQAQHAASMAEQHFMQQQQQLQQHQQQHATAPGAGSVVGGVLCPVCKSCQLLQRQGLLVCPGEGWALNLAAESLSMDTIQTRLAAAYEEHGASGCPGQLCFSIEDLFGPLSLTCSCSTCNSFAVVV